MISERNAATSSSQVRASPTIMFLTSMWGLVFLMAGCIGTPRQLDPDEADNYVRELAVTVSDIMDIAIAPDHSNLIIGGGDGVALYTLDPALKRVWKRFELSAQDLDLDSTGQQIAVVEDSGVVLLLDSATGKTLKGLQTDNPGPTSVAFSPDGTLVAVGKWGGGVIIWDVHAEKIRYNWRRPPVYEMGGQETVVGWTSDGNYLVATGSDDELEIWDMETGNLSRSVTLDSRASNMDVSPDDRYIAVISETSQIAIYEAGSGLMVTNWGVGNKTEPVYGRRIYGIAWSHDSSMLAISDFRGVVTVWNSADFSLIDSVTPVQDFDDPSTINSIEWMDDEEIYFATYSGAVYKWNLRTDELSEIISW